MNKIVSLVLLGLIAHSAGYSTGAGSCTTPGHPGTFSPGNGGFMATFIEKTPGDPMMNQPVMKWMPDHKYQVEFKRPTGQPYKGFILAMSDKMALTDGIVGMNMFMPGDSMDLRFINNMPDCNGAVTHTENRTDMPRTMDKFTWMAPSMPMDNVALVGVGVVDRPNYFKVLIPFMHWNETNMNNMTGPPMNNSNMPPMNGSNNMPPPMNHSNNNMPPPMNNMSNMSMGMPPNGMPMDECMNITSCGECSQESACRWCADSMKCELKTKPTQCKKFGCLKCGTNIMPDYLCNSESQVVGGKCQCKDPARKWCNMGVCQMKGACGVMANPNQPCSAGTERVGGAPLSQAANCMCVQTGLGQNGSCHTNPPCALDAAAAFAGFVGDMSNKTFPVPSGSALNLAADLDLGTTRLEFGSGGSDETGSLTSSGGVKKVTSRGVDFDVDLFEAIDIILEVFEATFKRIMTWAGGPRCKIGGQARFEADVTFSGAGGNFEIDSTAAVSSDPGTRVIFGTSFDLKMGGSFSAGGPLEFGSSEEVSVVKIDGTLASPANEEIVLSNDADIQISGTIDATDPANPPTIRGYGCNFQGSTGAVVNGIMEFHPKPTSAASHRGRQAVAQVEDSTGYSNTLGGATVHNAFIDADATWLNPGVGFMVNAGMRLHSSSALYFSDAFDLAAANFGGSWNGLMVTGTVTLDNCVVVLDMGDSTGGGSFPSTDPFVLLEADAIVGTAFITVAADEGMGAATMWSAKIVANGARWQLQAHRHVAATWADPSTNIRSKLWGVFIDGASWPTLDASNFATTLDTAITAVWQKNAAAWQASGFYMSEVSKIDTTDASFPMVVFSYHAPAATVEYINEVLMNLFRYDGVNTFYAASALKAASSEFQCATSDNPTPSAPVYACHPDYFTAHGPCTAQTLNDNTCGAARKENCFVKPEDSPHCFLVE